MIYTTPILPDELYHFGIKGQRWGIRRYQNEDGSYTEAGRKRYGKLQDKYDYQMNVADMSSNALTKVHRLDNANKTKTKLDIKKARDKAKYDRKKFTEYDANYINSRNASEIDKKKAEAFTKDNVFHKVAKRYYETKSYNEKTASDVFKRTAEAALGKKTATYLKESWNQPVRTLGGKEVKAGKIITASLLVSAGTMALSTYWAIQDNRG